MGRYYAQIHLLEDCNLKCLHCYQEKDPRAERLSLQDCKKLFDSLENIARDQEIQVNLTGGEPLLSTELFPVIEEIRRRKMQWSLLTNGTLLTPELAEKLAFFHPVFVQVSLEGGQETNDRIRGEGTFRQILRGIFFLKAAGIKVLVSFTVNGRNWREFPEVAKLCREHQVDKLWCDRYVGSDELCISTEDFRDFLQLLGKECQTTEPEKLRHVLPGKNQKACSKVSQKAMQKDAQKEESPLSGCEITGTRIKAQRSLQFLALTGDLCSHHKSIWESLFPEGFGKQKKQDVEVYQCGAGGNLIVICANGDVLPCRRLPITLGNIHKDTLENILKTSEVFSRLAEKRIPVECFACGYREYCRGGAKCVTYAQTRSLCKKDVNCPLT